MGTKLGLNFWLNFKNKIRFLEFVFSLQNLVWLLKLLKVENTLRKLIDEYSVYKFNFYFLKKNQIVIK